MGMGREGGDWCKSYTWLGFELMGPPGRSSLGVGPGKCESGGKVL